MASLKSISALVDECIKITTAMRAAMAAPDEARKELSTAVIGHKNWDGYGLREIKNTNDLHRRAVDAVTDYLVNDLAARKKAEIAELAERLDGLRNMLAAEAAAVRFALLDDVRAAREWTYDATRATIAKQENPDA